MVLDPAALPEEMLGFLAERHLASLATLRVDGGNLGVQADGAVCQRPRRLPSLSVK